MDHDAAGWSTEDITLLIETLHQPVIQQFVREHPYLQRSFAGFTTRLPPNYAQRLAGLLSQRAAHYQRGLQELLKLWRQKHQALCEALKPLEPLITLDALTPLTQQYGGRATLAALRSDPRSEAFRETFHALKQAIDRGEIAPKPDTPPPAPPAPKHGKSAKHGAATIAPQPTPATHRERTVASIAPAIATLPKPISSPASRAAPASAPKATIELFVALEEELHVLQSIEQTITTQGAQLAQHQTLNDPQALPRIIERLNAATEKRKEGFVRFAALYSELLEQLRLEVQQAEAAGQIVGLSASLPRAAAPNTISEANACIQTLRQAHERLAATLTLNEQRLAALNAAPVAIETLLYEIDELGGEAGPLRASLGSLKASIPEHADARRLEPALQRAGRIQGQATSLRSGLLEDWHNHLQRALRDSESLLNQSLHLSADLPEITNLQHSLQQARALLDTPLAPNAPVPLTFPPAQIIACHQTLGQQSGRLRQALATYNPQIALATLHDFEEANALELTPQQLQKIGAALVGAASMREGYAGLIWRVGTTILAALDNAAAEQFYERYGLAAVATAIAASLRNGDFPLGLAFAETEHLFYPTAEIASIFKHERLLDILSYASATASFPPFPADCFANASPVVRQAAIYLLARAGQINLPEPLPLQLSAALLTAATTPTERAEAGRLLIHNLLDQQQRLNAYCVWRALTLEQPNLITDPTGLDALYSLVWHLTVDTHVSGPQLAALCGERDLQEASSFVPGIALALALGSLALARARHPHGEEWASFFLDILRDHHHYLVISDALRARLPRPASETPEDAADEISDRRLAIQAQLTAALNEASRRLQSSNYRFAPTKQMRNQIDAQLKPLLTALQQGLELTSDLGAHLHEADLPELARMLIQDAEKMRRQEGRDPIEGNDLKKLRKDLEHLLKHLVDAATRRAELLALGVDLQEIRAQSSGNGATSAAITPEENPADQQRWDGYESLYADLRRLLAEVPQARDLLQRALPDLSLDLS